MVSRSLSFLFLSTFKMSSPSPSLRKRGGKKEANTALPSDDGSLKPASAPPKPQSEWDYWLALSILTLLAFVTRFWRIDYPNEVVFDEVHFGKVCLESCANFHLNWSPARATTISNIFESNMPFSASSPHTTCNVPTSLMSTRPLESCCSPLWAG